jgi:uncharacterized protein YbjT (DUF2867 family)
MRRWAVTHVFCLIGTTRSRARREGVVGDRYRAIDAGLTRTLVDAALASGTAPRFIYLSSIGADPTARSAYLRARGDAEAAVTGSGLSHLILRPSFITGLDREEARPGERVAARVGDVALAAIGLLGGSATRERYRSRDGAAVASALVGRGLDAVDGVIDGAGMAASGM